jgi:membrane protease YdiL (CAAX protease family)
MSRFSEEMKVIPRPARIIAVVAALLVPFVALCFVVVVRLNPAHGSLAWVPFAALAGVAVMVMVSIYILLVGYIVGDSRRRGMRPLLWALLAIFIPNAIGIILYFILREPLLQHCPKCGAGSRPSFTFCSVCGEALSKTCPSCRGPVQPGWSHCAQCGTLLPTA